MRSLLFKHVTFFGLAPGLDLATLEEQLGRQQFQPCSAEAEESVGWVETVAEAGLAGCQIDGQVFVTVQVETKRVPGSAIAAMVDERIVVLEKSQGFKAGKKQIRELKEAVMDELLVRAIPSIKRVLVWIDTKEGWLAVNSGSAGDVDMVTRLLGRSLDAFPCVAVKTVMAPSGGMTLWLASEDSAPAGFTVDMDCTLTGTEGQSVRFSKLSLLGQVEKHLEEGKTPVSLGLTFNSRVSFVLTDTMALKKMSFVDVILEGHKENNASSETAKNAALGDLVFLGGELRLLLPALIGVLGGAVVESAATEQLKAA